jgi:hypothetical protein
MHSLELAVFSTQRQSTQKRSTSKFRALFSEGALQVRHNENLPTNSWGSDLRVPFSIVADRRAHRRCLAQTL